MLSEKLVQFYFAMMCNSVALFLDKVELNWVTHREPTFMIQKIFYEYYESQFFLLNYVILCHLLSFQLSFQFSVTFLLSFLFLFLSLISTFLSVRSFVCVFVLHLCSLFPFCPMIFFIFLCVLIFSSGICFKSSFLCSFNVYMLSNWMIVYSFFYL